MNDIFCECLRKFVLVFFDGILVYNRSIEEHRDPLARVLEILATHQLYANKKKCQFGRGQIEYLGHIILSDRVMADKSGNCGVSSVHEVLLPFRQGMGSWLGR